MDFTKQNEVRSLLSMYKTKLVCYMEKHTTVEVVTISKDETSYYNSNKGTIFLRENAPLFVKYHELGHDIWHNSGNPRNEGIEKFLSDWEIRLMGVDDAVDFLDSVFMDYHLSIDGITPFSDLVLGIINKEIDIYPCHKKGYYKSFPYDQYANELFANICGIIGTRNFRGFMTLNIFMPDAVNSILGVLDKCTQL